MKLGLVTNLGKEYMFPYVCIGCTAISLICIYVFQVYLDMGLYSFMLGLSVNFGLQVVIQFCIIWNSMPINLFSPPAFRDICSNNSKILKFLVEYSVAFLLEYATYEVNIFILLLSHDAVTNILIWSSFAQIVNMVYFIGYAIASFVRNIGTRLLGLEKPKSFKLLIYNMIFYTVILYIIISLLGFYFARSIASLYTNEKHTLNLFTKGIRIFSIFFLGEAFFVLLNSTLRLLDFSRFTMIMVIILFAISLPLMSSISVLFFGGGVTQCIILLAICDFCISCCFLIRLFYRLEDNIMRTIEQIKSTNKASLEN